MPPRLAAVALALTPLRPETIGPGGAALIARILEGDSERAPALTAHYSARHPLLTRVHAIAAVSVGAPGEPAAPALYAAPRPEDEAPMLRQFWRDVELLEAQATVTWVLFNRAESFLAEALARTARHGLAPYADLLVHQDPGTPGLVLDLARAFHTVPLAEPDLATLLDVPVPALAPPRVRFAGSGDPAEAQALAAPLARTVATRLATVEAALPYLDPDARRALRPFFEEKQMQAEGSFA